MAEHGRIQNDEIKKKKESWIIPNPAPIDVRLPANFLYFGLASLGATDPILCLQIWRVELIYYHAGRSGVHEYSPTAIWAFYRMASMITSWATGSAIIFRIQEHQQDVDSNGHCVLQLPIHATRIHANKPI